jgi:crotonobetainyl-CoA:carnitine CoA-transferase CaiB-like acyl-CoA transferase
VSEVATVPELVRAEHFRARDVFVAAAAPGHGAFDQVGWVFAGMRRDQPGPTVRDASITDTDAVLGEAGYSPDEIAALREEGVAA